MATVEQNQPGTIQGAEVRKDASKLRQVWDHQHWLAHQRSLSEKL